MGALVLAARWIAENKLGAGVGTADGGRRGSTDACRPARRPRSASASGRARSRRPRARRGSAPARPASAVASAGGEVGAQRLAQHQGVDAQLLQPQRREVEAVARRPPRTRRRRHRRCGRPHPAAPGPPCASARSCCPRNSRARPGRAARPRRGTPARRRRGASRTRPPPPACGIRRTAGPPWAAAARPAPCPRPRRSSA